MRLGHLVVALLLSAPARADAPAGSSAEDRVARAHFEVGQRQYQRGQYQLAIVEFKAAYAHAHVAALLFNTAQAYRALHDERQAVVYFEAYLRAAPHGTERRFAQARLAELRRPARPRRLVR